MSMAPALRGTIGKRGGDPFFSNVVLLSHMDTSSYVDVKGHAETTTGSPTNPSGLTGFGNCLDCGTSGGNYVQWTPSAGDMDLGTGNFTIELMVLPRRINVAEAYLDLSGGTLGVNAPLIYSNGVDGCYLYYGGADHCRVSALSTASWNQIALVRNGNVFTMYNAGVAGTNTTDTPNFTSLKPAAGASNTGTFQSTSKIDEIRITKGVARYTSNYTVPTAPYPNF